MDSQNIDNMVKELREYAQLEGSEIGELCLQLCDIYHYYPYMTENFKKEIEKEIKIQLQNFKDHCMIVERSEEITQKWKELEWY